jgi:hypothetical protein
MVRFLDALLLLGAFRREAVAAHDGNLKDFAERLKIYEKSVLDTLRIWSARLVLDQPD